MRWPLVLCLLLGARCRTDTPVKELEPVLPPAEQAPQVATGSVIDGRFVEGTRLFTVAVPEGWQARPGVEPSALRLVLEHASDGVTIEVWVFEEDRVQFRERAGCSWTFEDQGPYDSLRVAQDVVVGSCHPGDPQDPRVLGTGLIRRGKAVHVEVVLPAGALVSGGEEAQSVLSTMRFE